MLPPFAAVSSRHSLSLASALSGASANDAEQLPTKLLLDHAKHDPVGSLLSPLQIWKRYAILGLWEEPLETLKNASSSTSTTSQTNKLYFFDNHRKPSQNHPTVRGGLFSNQQILNPFKPNNNAKPYQPFDIRKWRWGCFPPGAGLVKWWKRKSEKMHAFSLLVSGLGPTLYSHNKDWGKERGNYLRKEKKRIWTIN